MSLPSKKAIQVDDNTIDYEYKMLNHVMVLRYHEDKCVECGFCHRVCPVTISIYDEPLKRTAMRICPKVMNPFSKGLYPNLLKIIE